MAGNDQVSGIVRNRRLELSMTQSELAEAATVSVQTLRNLERGLGKTRGSTLLLLEKALGWPPGTIDLMMDSQGPDPRPPAPRAVAVSPAVLAPAPVKAVVIAQANGLRMAGKIRAAIDLLHPEEITPVGKRILEKVLNQELAREREQAKRPQEADTEPTDSWSWQ